MCCRWTRCEIWWLASTLEFEPLMLDLKLHFKSHSIPSQPVRQDVIKLYPVIANPIRFLQISKIAWMKANLNETKGFKFCRVYSLRILLQVVYRNRHWLTWLVIVFLPHLHLLEISRFDSLQPHAVLKYFWLPLLLRSKVSISYSSL